MDLTNRAAAALQRLFQHRPDDYAVQVPTGGYRPVGLPLDLDALLRHVRGKWVIGVYLVKGSTVRCLCLDVDGAREVAENAREGTAALAATCRKFGLEPLVEWSGGKGWHVWVLTEEIEASLARAVGKGLVLEGRIEEVPGVDHVEIFPKQPSVNESTPFGNLVKLPFAKRKDNGRTAQIRHPETLEELAFEEQVALLENVRIYPAAVLAALCEENEWQEERQGSAGFGGSLGTLPCFSRIMECGVDQGNRDNIAYRLAVLSRRQGLPPEATSLMLAQWDTLKVKPPLGFQVIEQKVRSAYRGGLSIGCEVIQKAELCPALEGVPCPVYGKQEAEEQPAREGVRERGNALSIEPLRIIKKSPPTYIATVNGQQVQLSLVELMEFRAFKRVVMGTLQFIPTLPAVRDHEGKKVPPQAIWENQYVNPALQSVVDYEDAPADASLAGIVWDNVCLFFKRKKRSENLDDLHEDQLVFSEGHFMFRGRVLRGWLRQNRLDVVKEDELWMIVRNRGGTAGNQRTPKGQVWAWRVPRDTVDTE